MTGADRYTRDRSGPICSGYPGRPAGTGTRCAGFRSDDGARAVCTRGERAGAWPRDDRTAQPGWWHRLDASCARGMPHRVAPPTLPGAATGARGARRSGPHRAGRICILDGWALAVPGRQDYTDGTKRCWW